MALGDFITRRLPAWLERVKNPRYSDAVNIPTASEEALEQPWIDPVDAIGGAGSSLAKMGAKAALADFLIDPVVGFALEQSQQNTGLSAIPTKKGISKTVNQAVKGGDLVAMHNLTPGNLRHSVELGGIPVPSLAVINKEHGFDSFGDISLIADKSMIDRGSGAKVFGGDAYTPRYPSVDYKIKRDELSKLQDEFSVLEKQTGDWDMLGDIEHKGKTALEWSPNIKAKFLKSKGENIPTRNYTDDSKISRGLTDDAMGEVINNKNYKQEFDDFVLDQFNTLVDKERIFKGHTPSGNRKYVPHTLDEVVKIMKKDLRSGEGFNYGVGSIRASVTPQFKSVAEIRKNKDKLVSSSDFERVKDEVNDEFWGLIGDYGDKMKNIDPNSFGVGDSFSEYLKEIPKYGIDYVMREYFKEGTDPGKMLSFLNKLKEMPTEYFEAVIPRAVDISEFSAAVIPQGLPQTAIDTLKRNGIERIETYVKGDAESRKMAIKKLKDLAFMLSAGVGLKQFIQEDDNRR